MKCTKCGNEIAEGTKFCPVCGAPAAAQKKKKHTFSVVSLVLAGIVLLIVLISGSGGSRDAKTSSSTVQEGTEIAQTDEKSTVQEETQEAAETTEDASGEAAEAQETPLFPLAADYKNMRPDETAEVDGLYVALDYLRRGATTHDAFGNANEIDPAHEVVVCFVEFYNASDELQSPNQDDFMGYADDVEVKGVESYLLSAEDGIEELQEYEIDPGTACRMMLDFEVPKGWTKFELYYESDCVWHFSSEEVGEAAYDGHLVLTTDTAHEDTPEGTVLSEENPRIVYDGYELHTYNSLINGDEKYIVYKYTLTNTAEEAYENSLVGYGMRGYCNNYLLDGATYTMNDKIGEYINIYDLEAIQPGKSMQAYVAFETDEAEAAFSMTFDMGYLFSDVKDRVYVSTAGGTDTQTKTAE